MQVAVLSKRTVRKLLFYFHNGPLLEQFVYILLKLGYLVFIFQIINHTLKRRFFLRRIDGWLTHITRLLRVCSRVGLLLGCLCRLLRRLPGFDFIGTCLGEILHVSVLVLIAHSLEVESDGDDLSFCEPVQLGAFVTGELQLWEILESAPLARLWVVTCRVQHDFAFQERAAEAF